MVHCTHKRILKFNELGEYGPIHSFLTCKGQLLNAVLPPATLVYHDCRVQGENKTNY